MKQECNKFGSSRNTFSKSVSMKYRVGECGMRDDLLCVSLNLKPRVNSRHRRCSISAHSNYLCLLYPLIEEEILQCFEHIFST
jgi:hypothetical protein